MNSVCTVAVIVFQYIDMFINNEKELEEIVHFMEQKLNNSIVLLMICPAHYSFVMQRTMYSP